MPRDPHGPAARHAAAARVAVAAPADDERVGHGVEQGAEDALGRVPREGARGVGSLDGDPGAGAAGVGGGELVRLAGWGSGVEGGPVEVDAGGQGGAGGAEEEGVEEVEEGLQGETVFPARQVQVAVGVVPPLHGRRLLPLHPVRLLTLPGEVLGASVDDTGVVVAVAGRMEYRVAVVGAEDAVGRADGAWSLDEVVARLE